MGGSEGENLSGKRCRSESASSSDSDGGPVVCCDCESPYAQDMRFLRNRESRYYECHICCDYLCERCRGTICPICQDHQQETYGDACSDSDMPRYICSHCTKSCPICGMVLCDGCIIGHLRECDGKPQEERDTDKLDRTINSKRVEIRQAELRLAFEQSHLTMLKDQLSDQLKRRASGVKAQIRAAGGRERRAPRAVQTVEQDRRRSPRGHRART